MHTLSRTFWEIRRYVCDGQLPGTLLDVASSCRTRMRFQAGSASRPAVCLTVSPELREECPVEPTVLGPDEESCCAKPIILKPSIDNQERWSIVRSARLGV